MKKFTRWYAAVKSKTTGVVRIYDFTDHDELMRVVESFRENGFEIVSIWGGE